MAVVFDLDDVEGVLGDFNGDLGCGGVEGVVKELFDEGEGVGEGLAGAKGADGGGGESFDWHYAGDELEWVEEWVRGGGDLGNNSVVQSPHCCGCRWGCTQ